ncbi:ABC-type multidrug transport system fused ATPase/permease subunit [Rhodopseudomonas rhenobacensis]|uniref:ABC-type multidrug transport system fused ATPase/permease subunit n=1 Tax=Rhodopseudomonas rhenobacensis TaxID=87461 RepID=A0A7W8DYU7_9BRAD|nr:ABC-type multidrug transport system fused ATPase/permease subunit [Rhodopseudomonas rhenobacensis]
MHAGDAAAEIQRGCTRRRVVMVVIMRKGVIMRMIMNVVMRTAMIMVIAIVMMMVVMMMSMAVGVLVLMIVAVVSIIVIGLAVASAHRTHQSTSNSLTRRSSPAVTCN